MDFYRWKKKSGDTDGIGGSLKCHIKQKRETYYQLYILDFQIWGIDSNHFSPSCAYEQTLNSNCTWKASLSLWQVMVINDKFF